MSNLNTMSYGRMRLSPARTGVSRLMASTVLSTLRFRSTHGAAAGVAIAVLLGGAANAAEPSKPMEGGVVAPGERPDGPSNSRARPATVDEVVVTGSLIPTTLDAVAVPVQTISSEVIARGGVTTNALDLLRKEIPAFEGRNNAGSSTAGSLSTLSAGTAAAVVRNLDTLVLINGRRTATSATAALGGRATVDIRDVPASQIGRVEVLTDGASALYGSEAIGGVVNFILKSNLDGAEAGARYATADGYTERSAYALVGHNIRPGVNVTLGASFNHSDPLSQHERPFSNPFFLSSGSIPGVIGANQLSLDLNSPSQVNPTGAQARASSLAALIANGTYVASSAAAIGRTYDLSQFQNLLVQQDQSTINGSFRADLADDGHLVAFGDAEYSRDVGRTQLAPAVAPLVVPANAPFNPLTVALPGVIFGDAQAPRGMQFLSKYARATVGLRGNFELWSRDVRWEVGYTHSQDDLTERVGNVLYSVNLGLAVLGGFDATGAPTAGGAYSKVYTGFSDTTPLVLQPALDPFARVHNPAALANVLGTEVSRASSRLDSVDATIVSTLFDLPAGGVNAALGAQWRKESLSSHADANGANTGPTAQRWIGGNFLDPFSNSRDVGSIYSEVRAPITSPEWNLPGLHSLDLIAAGRFERYSDAGSSLVPKFGFRWEPVDPQFTLAGTYSESFTAPGLYAEGSPTTTFTGAPSVITAAFPGLAGGQFHAASAGNPDLQPSTSRSYSLQAIFRPKAVPNFRSSIQYFAVDQQDFIGGYGSTNILVDVNQNGAASPVASYVARNNFPGLPGAVGFANPGDLKTFLSNPLNAANLYLIDKPTNRGAFKVRSIDLNLEYRHDLGELGSIEARSTLSYLITFKSQFNNLQRFYEYAGTATGTGSGIQGTLPQLRAYSTLNWTWRKLDVTLGHSFISSVEGQGTGGLVFETLAATGVKPDHVGSYSVFDLRVAYDFGAVWPARQGVVGAIGVNNIADRMPPLAPFSFPDNHADTGTYSPIGRLVYATLSARF